jgi:hypothetical protein
MEKLSFSDTCLPNVMHPIAIPTMIVVFLVRNAFLAAANQTQHELIEK